MQETSYSNYASKNFQTYSQESSDSYIFLKYIFKWLLG